MVNKKYFLGLVKSFLNSFSFDNLSGKIKNLRCVINNFKLRSNL